MANYDCTVRVGTKIDKKGTEVQLMALENRIVKTSDKIASLMAKMNELKDAKIPTQEYSEISAQIAKAESEFNKLLEKQEQMQREGKDNGVAWDRLNEKMEEAGNTIKYAKGELQDLVDTGKAFTLGSETDEYAKMGQQLRYLQNDLAVMNEKQGQLTARQQKAADGYKRLATSGRAAFTSIGNMIKKANANIIAFGQRIRDVAQKHLPALKKETERSNTALSGFSNRLRSLLSGIFIFNVISAGFRKMFAGIREGYQNLYDDNEKFKSSVDSLQASLATLKNALAAAFRPIVEVAIPYIQKLVGWLTEAANTVGQFIAALTGRKTYTRAIKQTASASKESADAAKDETEAIEEETDAMDKQLSPLDKLNVLSSEKNKEKDNDKKHKDDVVADAGVGGTMFEEVPIEGWISDMADKVKGVLEKLFAPLKAAWEQEGKFVIDSWKYALNEVWKLVKDIGRDFLEVWNQPATITMLTDILHIIGDIGLVIGHLARNFREAWNENETGKKILENIRDILADVIHNVRLAADATVEWADGLNFTPLLEAFEQFTASLAPLADTLSGVLTDFYTEVILPLGKWTLEKGLPDLLDVFTKFNNEVDWEKLREDLKTFWQHLEPFAETVGEGLIIFIERVSGALADFLNSPAFESFLTTVEEWMDNVTPEDVAGALEKVAKGLIVLKLALVGFQALQGLSGVFPLITTFFSFFTAGGAGIGSALSGICSGLGSLLGLLNPVTLGIAALVGGLAAVFATNEDVRESFQNAVNAITEGLQPAFEFVTNTLLPDLQAGWDRLLEILKPLGDFLKDAFTSIWQDMINPALSYIGEVVLPKLTECFENLWNRVLVPLGQFLAAVLEPVIQIVSDALKILWENVVVPLADAIGGLLSKAFEGLCDVFNNIVVPIVEDVIEAFQFLWDNVLAPLIDFLWETFKPMVENAFEGVKGVIEDLQRIFGDLIDFVVGIFTGDWKKAWNAALDVVKTIFGKIGEKISGLISKIGGLASKIKGAFSGATGTIQNSGSYKAVSRMAAPTAYTAYTAAASLQNVEIPAYATGQVIPRTMKQHLAILGDNDRETEIVSPLSTMRQAVMEAMAQAGLTNGNGTSGGNNIYEFSVDGQVFFRIMEKYASEYKKQHGGKPAFT